MIVAGFGLRGAATLASLQAALALAGRHLVPDALAGPADRATLLEALGAACNLPFIAVTDDRLAAIDTPTRSLASLAARGSGSVAEAAALAAAGPGATLLMTRRIGPDRMATCAVAGLLEKAPA